MAKASPRQTSSKLIQFRNVESRVYQTQQPLTARSNATNGTVFLTRGASQKRLEDKRREASAARREVEEATREAEYYSTAVRPQTPTKAAVPRSTERGVFKQRTDEDFIGANKIKASAMYPPSPVGGGSMASTEVNSKHSAYGRVPKYLEQRKAQWKEEQARLALEKADADCPQGMRLMAEEERLSTLETLEQSKIECGKQLAKLPFVVETPSARKKVETLEARLKEIENAIVLFSKTKVYIAKDM